jgi:hypothetical protein
LEAPGEGRHTIYLWLEDIAGNVSVAQAGLLEDGILHDATPPTTVVSFEPPPNGAGWFNSNVRVTLVAEDALSGPSRTTFQLDSQAPVSGTQLFISGDGQHDLLVSSTDLAGNTEPATSHTIRIDTQAPTSQLYALSRYSPDPDIPVRWLGNDGTTGQDESEAGSSGIASYDVQVKEGSSGSWQDWLTETNQSQATYEGQRGKVYRFRVRSIDRAGNASPWSTARESNVVWVDPVENGSFHNYTWQGWDIPAATLDYAMIGDTDLYPGLTVPAARLGSEIWEACNWRGNFPPMVLCGDSHTTISQTVTVPSLTDNPTPTLQAWYRVRTYDQITTTASIWASLCPDLPGPPWLVDSFDITSRVLGSGQTDLLWRDGNPLPQIGPGPNPPIPLRDLGWRLATVDMTPYAGQVVDLQLGNHIRLDARFNTWTDIHGVRIVGPQRRIFLPTVPQKSDSGPGEPLIFCTPDPPPQREPTGDFTPMTEPPIPDPEESNR